MSELRDAIADEVVTSSNQAAYDTADRVLACDEMQAIRKALRNMYDTRVRECGYGAAHEWLRALNLPLSVIAWVLEGEQ